MRYEPHLSFLHTASGSLLELHWRELDETAEQTERRWSRSRPSTWRNFSYLDMSENDLVLYLCAHGCRHAWFRVKWLGDIARLHTAERIDWDDCFEEARELEQERLLFIAQRLLKEVYGLAMPAGNQRERDPQLPRALVSMTLNALAASEPRYTIISIICAYRYDWLVMPQKSFREVMKKLFYRRDDYLIFPLPDWLFWLYVPLRPLSFLWRRVIRSCWKTRSSTA